MSQPQEYERQEDFTDRDGDDTNHGAINDELDAAALSINQIRDNLALIQRDDGALKNGIVTAESLSDSAFSSVLGEVASATAIANEAADRSTLFAIQAEADRVAAQAAAAAALVSQNAAASSETAAANSQTAAANSATSASNSASTATTKASEASTSASSAATSATNAATSASTATTKASEASTSATTATSAATTATTQASTATTKASEASASATAAATSLEEFDDRYLGSKTADPTTDNDGNPLLTGALYFNSVAGEMRVWAGTFWKATGSSVGGTINTAKYTATAGQTEFPIVYDVGFVHVYLNGQKIESGVDFTANNGTSVVLTPGATAGDVVDMIAFGTFSVANTYTKAEVDSFAVKLSGGQSIASDITINGVLVGRGSGSISTNTANGYRTLEANTTGFSNTAIGEQALIFNTTGNRLTAIGLSALFNNITGYRNTAVGHQAMIYGTDFFNSSGFGNGAQVTGSNQVQLGDSQTTTYVYGTVQNRSDLRDKADVRDTVLGLDFINALRPVDYKWDMREDYKPERPADLPEDATEQQKASHKAATDAWLVACKHENLTHDGSKKRLRYHHGLIAQEVKAIMDAKGIDFGGYQDHKVQGGEDVLSIGYDELIAPLIKAIQQLSVEVEALKARP